MFNFLTGGRNAGPKLSPQEIVEKAGKGELTVIDIRDAGEVRMTGKAEGALTIPMVALKFQADRNGPDYNPKIDPEKPIALYCASGARSGMAARMMRSLGYGEVHNLGGLGHCRFAGRAPKTFHHGRVISWALRAY